MPRGPASRGVSGHRRPAGGALGGLMGTEPERPCPCTRLQDAEVAPERHEGSRAGKWHNQSFQKDRRQSKDGLGRPRVWSQDTGKGPAAKPGRKGSHLD